MSRKLNDIDHDMSEGAIPAEKLAANLLVSMAGVDPVEAVCALAMVASHYIVTVGTEGHIPLSGHQRLQPGVQAALLDRVTELCQQVRASGAN